MPHNQLYELQYNLMGRFMNINIEKYDYIKYEELFSLILKSIQELLPTYFLSIIYTSINSKNVHIIIKSHNFNYSLDSKLSVIFGIQDFIINNIEVSVLH